VAAAVGLVGITSSLPAGGAVAARGQAVADPGGVMPHPSRVAVLALENRSYGQVIGSPNAPYINQLARSNSLATKYYALAHPSLPNYIALTGGSMFEIKRNCAACDTSGTNLVGQLNGAGISWKAYFEGLTSSSRPGARTSTYNPHYNPFVYYQTVRGKAANRSRVVSFASLRSDLRAGQLPRFSWIAPGVRHDGHNGSLRQADRYVARLVPQVLRGLGPNGVLYLTWDEGAHKDRAGVNGSKGGGQVALIAAGGAARHGATTATPANHYALLRTIEAGFGLPTLGNAGSPNTPLLSGLLQPRG
jgi:phosphatidylinositol-3-phosphatase